MATEMPYILVVEDSSTVRFLIRATLSNRARVLEADTIKAAMDMLRAPGAPKLSAAVVDYQLPPGHISGLPGYGRSHGGQLVAFLRVQQPWVKVLMVTASGDRRDEVLRLGAAGFIPKEGTYWRTLADTLTELRVLPARE